MLVAEKTSLPKENTASLESQNCCQARLTLQDPACDQWDTCMVYGLLCSVCDIQNLLLLLRWRQCKPWDFLPSYTNWTNKNERHSRESSYDFPPSTEWHHVTIAAWVSLSQWAISINLWDSLQKTGQCKTNFYLSIQISCLRLCGLPQKSPCMWEHCQDEVICHGGPQHNTSYCSLIGLPALKLNFRVTAEMGHEKEKDLKNISEVEWVWSSQSFF